VDALADVLASFDPDAYDPAVVRDHAMRFDTGAFREQIGEYVARAYRKHTDSLSVATRERASV
jgi:hypothetical protein